jgi:hypothetical protein
MRTTRVLVPLLAAGAAAAGVAAVNAGGQETGPPTGTMTFTLVTNDKDGTFIDQPPRSRKGPSPGDQFFGTGKVTGDATGTVWFDVTLYSGEQGIIRAVLNLPGGRIYAEERTINGKVNRGAIIGGDGKYAGARGDFEERQLKETKNSTTSKLTLSFVG